MQKWSSFMFFCTALKTFLRLALGICGLLKCLWLKAMFTCKARNHALSYTDKYMLISLCHECYMIESKPGKPWLDDINCEVTNLSSISEWVFKVTFVFVCLLLYKYGIFTVCLTVHQYTESIDLDKEGISYYNCIK